ncbi:MAG TPA: hypothetical protein VJ901_01195 [Thermoanaerobaculia bacterium]|nr:hypothetical protein [Thermoanaerobaculia bacterium]
MPDTTAAATLLTGMLSTTLDPLDLGERLHVAPIFEMTRGNHAPLDLEATVIRYRVLSSGRIVVAAAGGFLAKCPRCVRIHADRACDRRVDRHRPATIIR